MALEIERRFLVVGKDWTKLVGKAQVLRQGYLSKEGPGITVRVRIRAKEKAWLTLKAPAKGIANYEFEYLIPIEDGENLWKLAPARINKTRYELSLAKKTWVIDCFQGPNSPLVLAEVELPSADSQLEIPDWCGMEVTGQAIWSNASLAHTPLRDWPLNLRKAHGLD